MLPWLSSALQSGSIAGKESKSTMAQPHQKQIFHRLTNYYFKEPKVVETLENIS